MANNRLLNASVWIEGSIATFNVSTLAFPGQLGQLFEKDGCLYQIVKVDSSSITVTPGDAASWIDFDDFVVTTDISDTNLNQPAGVMVSTTTNGNYGVLQVRGPYATLKTDGGDDIAAGDTLWVDNSTDGVVDSTAAGTAPIYMTVAVATAADVDADNTVAAWINAPMNI